MLSQWVPHSSAGACSLKASLAARLIIGYQPESPVFWELLQTGVSGVIFFRQDFNPNWTPEEAVLTLRARHADLQAARLPGMPPLWLGLDQEGGQVERLPATWFPGMMSPGALQHLSVKAQKDHALLQAQLLQQLGFTLNYAPCLDVNANPSNPIIGVRSYGETAERVIASAGRVLDAYETVGLMPVVKHFPGHGMGQVDSHIALPTLTYNPQEQTTFAWAIQDRQVPVVMVAHGHYPALYPTAQPATLTPAIATTLLRNQLGFAGVSMTDDMDMGAIVGEYDAQEAAVRAIQAGVDVLLYRYGDARQQTVLESLITAYEQGCIDTAEHQQAVDRIIATRERLQQNTLAPVTAVVRALNTGQEQVRDWTWQTLQSVAWPKELKRPQHWLVVWPEETSLPHYAMDQPTLEEWTTLFLHPGEQVTVYRYCNEGVETLCRQVSQQQCVQSPGAGLVVATWLPKVGQTLLKQLMLADTLHKSVSRPCVHVAIGGDALSPLPDHWRQLPLAGWRPAHRAALVRWLKQAG